MTEEKLRVEETALLKERKSLECRLAEVKESLDSVRRQLLPFSQAQKALEKRLANGVDARKRAQTEAALARAREAVSLREQGKSWREVGDAMGLTTERARQVGLSAPRLERALQYNAEITGRGAIRVE